MANDLGQLVYTLTLNSEGFTGKLNAASDEVKASSGGMTGSLKETEEQSGKTGGAFSGMAGQFVIGQAIFAAAAKAMSIVSDGISQVKQASQDWQQQQQQLNAALKSTNDVSGVTKKEALDYADSLSKSTPITRDAALAAENMLLTFTGIHKNVFPQTTKAVADMATRMSGGAVPSMQQMNDTAIMVGKALNDPVNGMTKLQRVGVTFTDQQKEQIKTMEQAGNVTGAQTIILNELSKEFGGSAAANAQTFQGRIEMLKNSMIDWAVDMIPKLEAELNKLFDWFVKIGGEQTFKTILRDIGVAFKDITIVARLLWDALTGGDPTISKGEERFANLAKIMSQVGYYFDEFRTAVKLVWEAIRGGDPTLDQNHLQMAKFVVILNQAITIIKEVATTIVSVLKTAWDLLKMAIEGLLPSIEALFSQLMSNIVPALKEVWEAVTRLWNALQPALLDAIEVIAAVIGVTLYAAIWIAINVLRIAIEVFGAVIHIISNVIGWISNFITIVGSAAEATVIAIGDILGWFSKLPGMILGAVKSFGSLLYNAGRDLIDGLIHGIESMAGAVMDKVKNIGKGIEDTAKKILKIFSPSAVFSDIGANVALGLAGGISDSSHHAIEATKQMSTSVVQAGATTPANISNNSSNSSNSNVYNFGPGSVTLSTPEAVDEFFSIGNRNTALELGGGAPLAGTTRV